MTLNNSMLITPLPPVKVQGTSFEHGSVLDGKSSINGSALSGNQHPAIRRACKTGERYEKLVNSFDTYFRAYDELHVLDNYVFCLSLHDKHRDDGKLSMWRGYGANGNGVAIVIDTAKLEPNRASPLIFAEVKYGTIEKRLNWINARANQFAKLLRLANLADEQLYIAAYAFIERIKRFALFTKHSGFEEEQEWRVLYNPERDTNKFLTGFFSHSVTERGVEPMLRFPVRHIPGLTEEDLSMTKIIDHILLGPTHNSYLASQSVKRMMENLKKPELAKRIRQSGIPYRSG
jgi:hypothetical protein